ncbi:helix-turn-helix transcriptional regulator [Paenibacillus macerans]|uniref:Helix-turn-helix domain-containing protein n=2 Tax=Paenibacillus macerans TaxID=44252 RepID=A0A6N8EQ61_PAEMA
MTQLQLAEKAELRPSTISEIVRDSRTVINKEHLAKIADALEIDDISELIVLEKE